MDHTHTSYRYTNAGCTLWEATSPAPAHTWLSILGKWTSSGLHSTERMCGNGFSRTSFLLLPCRLSITVSSSFLYSQFHSQKFISYFDCIFFCIHSAPFPLQSLSSSLRQFSRQQNDAVWAVKWKVTDEVGDERRVNNQSKKGSFQWLFLIRPSLIASFSLGQVLAARVWETHANSSNLNTFFFVMKMNVRKKKILAE